MRSNLLDMARCVGSEFLDVGPQQCCVHCSIILQQDLAKLGTLVLPNQPYSSGIAHATFFCLYD
jgi:hypothetical protein